MAGWTSECSLPLVWQGLCRVGVGGLCAASGAGVGANAGSESGRIDEGASLGQSCNGCAHERVPCSSGVDDFDFRAWDRRKPVAVGNQGSLFPSRHDDGANPVLDQALEYVLVAQGCVGIGSGHDAEGGAFPARLGISRLAGGEFAVYAIAATIAAASLLPSQGMTLVIEPYEL